MIVEAARAVIVRNGVGATGLRDIAAEAGVSVGTVTYHFGSVAEILNEVVVLETERFYGAIVAAVDAEPDVLVGLRMLVAPLFGDTEQVRQHWRIWSDYWTAVVRRPEVAAEYAERIRVWEACLVRVIRRGVDAGVFRHAVDADTVALQARRVQRRRRDADRPGRPGADEHGRPVVDVAVPVARTRCARCGHRRNRSFPLVMR